LYLQDDVVFVEDWYSKFVEARKAVRKKTGNKERYVLSFYAAYRFSSSPITSYDAHGFYGNQALYFPKITLETLGASMRSSWDSSRGRFGPGCPEPDDIYLKHWCQATKTPIWCVVPNLVQHIGEQSLIDSKFHTSPTFKQCAK
jgi:hypothetical protein